ncbi:MAG: hypothetical protein ACTHK6_10630 [Solirubrobacterales bacterium]
MSLEVGIGKAAADTTVKQAAKLRRRDLLRNLLRALKKELRISKVLDADRAARDGLFHQVKDQLYDWEARGALDRFASFGDAAALDQFREQLDDKLDTEGLGADHDTVVAEVVLILERNLGRAQTSPEGAADAQAALTRQHNAKVGEEIKEEVGESTDRILDAIDKYGIGKQAAAKHLLKVDLAPEGSRKALQALGEADADLLARLQEEVGEPPDIERAVALVDEWPQWVAQGPVELLHGIARLIEQRGGWDRSTVVWERAALLVEGEERAGLLVRAAIASELAGNSAGHGELLDRARQIAPDHPRLILEEISEDDEPKEQLAALDRVQTDEPELAALTSLQRSLVFLFQGDFRAARKEIEAADLRVPGMIQTKLCHINVVVREARAAAGEDRPYDAPGLEAAAEQAGDLRTELLAQRRFEESGGLLALRTDALLLTGQSAAAQDFFDEVEEEELIAHNGAEVIADAAIRADLPRHARRFIEHAAVETAAVERIRLLAIAFSGMSKEVIAAHARLEDLAGGGEGEDAVHAASCLAILAIDKPQLGWSETAERVLVADGEDRLAIGAKAAYLARRGDPYGAMEILKPKAGERWALEAMLRVAKIWGPGPRRAEAAERLLARGPDQPMQLECGQAFAADGQFERAREVLVRLAGDHSAAKSIRSLAFDFSIRVVGRELDDWDHAEELLQQWSEALPGDPRISSWQPAIANHRNR